MISLSLINHQTFQTRPHTTTLNFKSRRKQFCSVTIITPKICCKKQQYSEKDDNNNNNWMEHLTKVAVVTLAAGALTLGSVDPASAAKSGGRVGGQAFRSSAPRPSSPRINNQTSRSRTNIYVNPQVAPPLVGGYGYGVPYYGGWGWSPFSFFAPAPSVAVGIGGGFDTLVLFMVLGAVAAFVRKFISSRDEEDY